jgi:heavy metal sensor kinase
VSRRPRSIRKRLTLWYAGAVALTVGLVSVTAFLLIRAQVWQQLEDELERHHDLMANIIAGPPEDELEEGELEIVWLLDEMEELEDQGVATFFRVAIADTLFHATEDWIEGGLEGSLTGTDSGPAFFPVMRMWTGEDEQTFLLTSIRLERPGFNFTARIAVEADDTQQFIRGLLLILALLFPLTLALAAAGGFLIAGRVLSPLESMADKAERITALRLSERLPVENPDDELGRLATIFNGVLARIEKAFEELRRFTGDASHALRTPLTAIRSVGEVGLQEGNGGDTYRDVIGSMLEETDRLRNLVENLLALTRAEGGQTRTDPERFDLSRLTDETVERLRVLSEEKTQELEASSEPSVEVTADREMIRQALLNLVDNAIRHTPVEGTIRIQTRRLADGRGRFEITDTGSGIPPEHLEHIFERFYRVESATEESEQGYGLGLAIARHAVLVSGGEIDAESEPGVGTTFRVTLPAPT